MTLSREGSSDSVTSLAAEAPDRRGLAVLCAGHLFDDMNQGAIPAMLPYFIAAHDLSYSAAAGLMLAVTVSSSVLQPFLGQFSDRHSAPWLVPLGLFLAGGGVALASVMPSYWLAALMIGISGVGVAAFHPEAARFANYASGARRASGMSVFSLGGNLGFALGPLLAIPLMLTFGLPGGLLLLIPAIFMSMVLAREIPRLNVRRRPAVSSAGGAHRGGTDQWGPFARLTAALISRSIVFYGLNTFIPLYWRDGLGQPTAAGGVALTILFASGATGTLLGGWLADRYGRRLVVLVGMGAVSALLAVFVSVHDPLLAGVLLVPIGLALFAPNSVMVVMGQEYLPSRVGTASGVTLGLSISVGGLAAPLLGRIGDSYGIDAVLNSLVLVPLLAVAFAAMLPQDRRG